MQRKSKETTSFRKLDFLINKSSLRLLIFANNYRERTEKNEQNAQSYVRGELDKSDTIKKGGQKWAEERLRNSR